MLRSASPLAEQQGGFRSKEYRPTHRPEQQATIRHFQVQVLLLAVEVAEVWVLVVLA